MCTKSNPWALTWIKHLSATLRQNQVTRFTIARFDRHLPIGGNVLAVVATEISVPILVADKIGDAFANRLLHREEIFAINGLRFVDDRVCLFWIRISFTQRCTDSFFGFSARGAVVIATARRTEKRDQLMRFNLFFSCGAQS